MIHRQHVGRGQRLPKEVARIESKAVGHTMFPHVVLKDRPHRRQIKSATSDVPMPEADLNGCSTLSGADVDDSLIALPRKTLCEHPGNRDACSCHGLREAAQES